MIQEDGKVEVKVKQEDLSCIATDFLGKRLDHWRAKLPVNARKIKDSMKRNYTIHNLGTLHACFRQNEYTPLCQIHVKDTVLYIDVQQLVI